MFFFFNDTATTEIYTLSLHDALPICDVVVVQLSLNGNHRGDLPMGLGTLPATGKEVHVPCVDVFHLEDGKLSAFEDRKSTRLNSSHLVISYAVFCLKKNNTICTSRST